MYKKLADEDQKTGIQLVEGTQEKARRMVYDYIRDKQLGYPEKVTFHIDDVFIMWFVVVLRNWKAIISTSLPDSNYYELTFDGEKQSFHLSIYKFYQHVIIPE